MTALSTTRDATGLSLGVATIAVLLSPSVVPLPLSQAEPPDAPQERVTGFEPMPGTTPQEWDEIKDWTDFLLDASEDATEMSIWTDGLSDKKDRQSFWQDWPLDIPPEKWGTVFYPTTDRAALDARSRLLAFGPKSVPAILEQLSLLDPGELRALDRARFATSILAELAYGHFPWRYGGKGGEELSKNSTAIDCWTALWSRAVEDPSYWQRIASHGAAQQLPRSWEHPESGLALGLFEGEQPFIKIEAVLDAGQRLRATTDAGTIEIRADEGFGRYFTWDGETRFVVLDPAHRKQGNPGSVGLSYSGPGDHWDDNHGISRGVLNEGCKHFDDVESAVAWVDSLVYMDFVHTGDGLVFGWLKNPSRRQINVDLWQVYVNGAKPEALPGGTDDRLTLSGD